MKRFKEAVLRGKGRLFLLILLALAAMISSIVASNAFTAPFAYISNNAENTVSVIDTSTNTVVDTIVVGSYPLGMAVNPSGSRVYVTNHHDNTVSVIDTNTNVVIDTISVGNAPHGIAVNPSGTRAYVANTLGNNVSVINTNDNSIVTTISVGYMPVGVAVHPSGSHSYVVHYGAHNVSVIDTSTNVEIATIPVGYNPYTVAVNPSGTRAYVANTASHNVSVIDTSTNTVIETISTGSNAVGVAVNPSGSRVYVTNAGLNNVSVIDPGDNSIITTVPVGSNPHGVAVNPSGTRVYVRNGDHTVSIIDTSINTVVDTVTVGSGPHTFGKFIGPGGCTQPPANLVAWWRGENNANDSIGTNHGTMMNGATFVAGKVGQAFSFDGPNDYVSMPDSSIFDFGIGDFTIDAWINTAAPSSVMRLISAGSEADGAYNLWTFGYGSHPYWGSGNRLNFAIYDGDGYPYTDLNSNEINLSANTWHHIAVVRSGSNLTFYFNGNAAGTANIGSINLGGGTTGAIIGARYYTNPTDIVEFANGLIDELAIFNRALTHEEIAAIYYAGSAGKCVPQRTLTVTKAGTGTGIVLQNIALNKPVTALTNTVAGYSSATAIVDGNKNTVWYSFQSCDDNSYNRFILDLETSYPIGIIHFFPSQINYYTIWTSDDQINWTLRHEGYTGWSYPDAPHPVNILIPISGAYSARYIKYEGDNRSCGYAGLVEFEVYVPLDGFYNYEDGTNVTLRAEPATGSTFAGWSGDADCSDGVVTMDGDKTCTATFNLIQLIQRTLTVTKAGTGSGTVISSPAGINCGTDCTEDYNQGTIVTLTATPDPFSTFAGWSGDPDCLDGVVTMDGDKICTATFTAWPIILISPAQGEFFTACSYYALPTFRWDTNEVFKSIEVQFSTQSNFATVLKAKGNPALKELLMTTAVWKKVLILPGASGGTVYWRVVGTKADKAKTKVLSNVRSFNIEDARAVGSPVITPTSIGGLPTLTWSNNCNIKFKVWFGSDVNFTKKKALAFNISNPNDNAGGFTKQLTSGQWTSIHKLVGSAPGSTIYWYVESWDVVKRYKKTSVMSFTLNP